MSDSAGFKQLNDRHRVRAESSFLKLIWQPRFETLRTHHQATHFSIGSSKEVAITGMMQAGGEWWLFAEDGRRLLIETLNQTETVWLKKIEPREVPETFPFGQRRCVLLPPGIDHTRPFTVKFDQEPKENAGED